MRSLRLASWFIGSALALFVIVFAVVWGPLYLFGIEGQLVLFPIALALLAAVTGLAVAGVVFSVLGLSEPSPKPALRRRLFVSLTTGVALIIIPLPALWFGNAPLVLFSGDNQVRVIGHGDTGTNV